jgi:serine protease Do
MAIIDKVEIDQRATGLFSALSAEASRVAEGVRKGVVVVRGDAGHGSGVIWHEDGVVITNDHVVARDRAEILLSDGRRFDGQVFRRDADRDLAALRVEASGLPAVPVGDSRRLRPGELILAVGNPLGVPGAVTVGIVSSTPQEVRLGRRLFPEMVRADVDLYPGNSGGPLVNAEGQVVGINSMVIGPGMALAIPSHAAEAFLAGAESRGYLGMTIRGVELPAVIAQPLGIATDEGLMVFELAPEGPAEVAGVLPGDLLIAMDGKVLSGAGDLRIRLARLGPRRPTRLTFLRAGRLVDLTAVPGEREEVARAA